MWKPSAPVCRSIPFSRSAEPRVALPASPLAWVPCLCSLPVPPTIAVQEEVYWPCPSNTQNNVPSLVQTRLRSHQPGPALQTCKEAAFSLPPSSSRWRLAWGGWPQPEHTTHSRCAGLSTSIPSQLFLWQCLVGVVRTPLPCPISQPKSSWLRAQLRKTLVWDTQGQASHLVFLAQHP